MVGARSGVVAVVGRPNVGKSTLVNALVGEKVAIVSGIPQTTRCLIRGIRTTGDAQIVLTDTPGIHKPRTELGRRLNGIAAGAIEGVDVVVQVVDASAGVGRGDAHVFDHQVEPSAALKVCAVNKTDLLRRRDGVLPQLAAASELGGFDDIVPVSAATGDGLEELLDLIVGHLPEGPPLYPADEATDQPLETRLAELVREGALQRAREELPHSITVVVEEVEREEGLVRVHADVIVERESQKGMVIGKGGTMLREIGRGAREEMERLLGERVFLDLRVKVSKDWQRDPAALDRLGL